MSLVERLNTVHRRFRADIARRAVPDEGIDLRRHTIPIAHIEEVQEVPVVVAPSVEAALVETIRLETAEPSEADRIEQQIKMLTAKLQYMREQAEIQREVTVVPVNLIQRTVATAYNVTRADLISTRRTANVVRPRQIAVYITKQLTTHSLPKIGMLFGGRDHTTILHSVRKIASLRAVDSTLDSEVEKLMNGLKPKAAE